MSKIISRDDYVENRVFVLCDCAYEVIEITRSTDGEIFIGSHSEIDKHDSCCSFYFDGEVDFKIFID